MAIQDVASLTNSVRTQYIAGYLETAVGKRLYDQFAVPYTKFARGMSMAELMQSTASSGVQITFLSSMVPGTTAIPAQADVSPQTLRDATATVSHSSRWGALQWNEATDIQVYTDYGMERFKKLGEHQALTVDLVAQAAALQGSWVYRSQARASLNAGTTTDYVTEKLFAKMQGYLQNLRVPGFITEDGGYNEKWVALMHPYAFHDLRENDHVESIGNALQPGIHLNYELARLGAFRILVSAWHKTFYGAGADNSTAIGTTLASAANALATTATLTSGTSVAAGMWLNIGTEETADTHYATNERVYVLTADTGTGVITFLGEGENGGLKYDHAALEAVNNNDSVYPVLWGGPESLVKLFAQDIGEFGQVVGPEEAGLLHQFTHIGWKWYGGYNRLTENRLLRSEHSVSMEA